MDTVKELGWTRFSKKDSSDISEMDMKAVFKLVDMDNSGSISKTVSSHSRKQNALIKKKITFSSYIREFRVEQLQRHTYMTNGLLIYGEIFVHFLIY
jgi:hypothetical protein